MREHWRILAAGTLRAVLAPAQAPAGAPLLCFLHGYDEAAPAEIYGALTKHGPLHHEARPQVRERFTVVAPQMPAAGDHWRRYAGEIRELVERLQREGHAGPDRCYLTGFSFGGNGVFDIALQQPGVWAALWAVDPTRLPSAELCEPVWVSIGEAARRRTNGFVDRLMSHPLDAEPAGRRIHLDEGLDHVACARNAYADARIYRWLLRFSVERARGWQR